MDIYDLKKQKPEEIKEFLEVNATEVKDQTYMKPLNEVELNIKRDEFAQAAMQKEDLQEELNEYKKEHKAKMSLVQSTLSNSLSAIKHKAVQVTGPAHKISDFDNQAIHFVADDGTVISSRPMLPEERQFTITHQISKAI